MKILVGIIANDAARFSMFTSSVLKLDTTGLDVEREMLIGGDWCGARNTLVEMTLEGDYTHLWFMDDDHAFAPDLLQRLARWDQALVNPICLARTAPFPLVTYASKGEGDQQYLPINLDGAPAEGLIELEAAGCAGMLIRRDVLEAVVAMGGRVFEYGDRSEDIIFCERAKACGFTLHADLGARLGHITTAIVWPDTNAEGAWMTHLNVGSGLDLLVSPAADWEAANELPDEEPLQIAETVNQAEVSVGTEIADLLVDLPPGMEKPTTAAPADAGARIEMWVDDDLRWWWRLVPAAGDAILAEGSSVSEEQAMADAHYQAVLLVSGDPTIHIIPNGLMDSRQLQRYGPPTRLWNRGDQ